MRAFAAILPPAACLALLAPLPAMASGAIGIMERGSYVCELPDEAAVRAGVRMPERDFRIIGGSHYASADARGTYLRRGDVLTLTSGARKGETYQIVSEGFLRLIENGALGKIRCVRLSR